MTVASSTSRSGPYAGAGSVGPFPIGFYFLADSHLSLIRADSESVETVLVLGTDYSIVGAGSPAGGAATLTTALAPGYTLTIQRNVPLTQLLDYTQSDAFPAESHESGLDKLTMAIQQVDTKTVGALRVPELVGVPNLPAAAARAGSVLGFDALGNPAMVAVQAAGSFTYGSSVIDRFTGDDSTTVFALSANPGLQNNLDVWIGGVLQDNGVDYIWTSGTTLTFTTAPPVATIRVKYVRALPMGVLDLDTATFTADGSGAVQQPASDKLGEWPSVLDFGAFGDGVTLDTQAFLNAQAAFAFIRVPGGMNCKVAAGINYWQFFGEGRVFEPGKRWDLSKTPQTSAAVKGYKVRTYGTYEQAVGVAFSINSASAQGRDNVQVLGVGTNTSALASTYTDRDHVAAYAQAFSFEPEVTSASTTYTATTLADSSVSALTLEPGMIVDTKHVTPYTGRIQSWSGNTITVDGWYLRGSGAAGTPANGTGAIVNPNTKVWVQNSNLFLSGNATNNQAQKGTGYELGISCDPTTTGSNVWGFDAVTLGGKPEMHFQSRGSRTYGYYSRTGADYSYTSQTNGVGFESRDDTVNFSTTVAGTQKWSVMQGALALDYRAGFTMSASAAIPTNVSFIITTGVSQTYPLESPVGKEGRCYTIRALNNSTLSTAAGLIDGASTKAMSANTTYRVRSDNTNWMSF